MNWYCIYTKPVKEAAASRYLTLTLGFECYYPKLIQQVTIRRVKRTVARPLFPRYFFCHFNADLYFRSVRYAADVVDVVSSSSRPLEVSDAIIASLRARGRGAAQDEILPDAELRPGCKLAITNGPMRGLDGIVLHAMDDGQRVAILLSALNLSGAVVMDSSQCVRVA